MKITNNAINGHLIRQSPRVGCWTLRLVLALMLSISPLKIYANQQSINQDRPHADALRQDLRDLISSARDAVFPSLVNIRVITSRFPNGQERKGQSVGSGTIISEDGLVLTNFHVVRNGRKFICTLADKSEVTAELVGEDPLTDLALLQLDLSELNKPDLSLPVARLGDSDALMVGDTVMSMGSPWALSRSVTLGIVSNTNRIFVNASNDAEGMRFNRDQRTGIYTRWIQHDSAISPGNSGGPLVNLLGEVIGVNTLGSTNMGFAIPSNMAREVATALAEHGHVPRSWFGWTLKHIRNSGFEQGVLVNSTIEKGPAANAGIQAGDILLVIDGEPVTVWFPEEKPPLLMKLSSYRIGSEIKLLYKRGDENLETTLTTGELQPDRGQEAYFREWGIVGIGITRKMSQDRRLDSMDGVLVQGARRGGPAQTAEPSVNKDDVINAVNGEKVATLDDLIRVYESTTGDESLSDQILFEFSRLGRSHVTLLRVRNDRTNRFPPEVAKAWIGVSVQPVLADLAQRLGSPRAVGFRITRVYPSTNADKSGLAEGDIILSLNGERLRPRGKQDSGMFHRQVRRLDIGDQAVVTVSRMNEEQEFEITLERTHLTPAEVDRDKNEDFGISVREVTFFDRDENRWPNDIGGVLVEKTTPVGWAQLGGIQFRDLILEIDGSIVSSLEEYRAAMKLATDSRSERVTFLILRGAETRFQHIEPDWTPQDQYASLADETNKTHLIKTGDKQ